MLILYLLVVLNFIVDGISIYAYYQKQYLIKLLELKCELLTSLVNTKS